MKGTVRPDFSVVSKQTRTESRHFLTENTQIIQHKHKQRISKVGMSSNQYEMRGIFKAIVH